MVTRLGMGTVAAVAAGAALLLFPPAFSTSTGQRQEQKQAPDDVVKSIERLLDEKLAKLKKEIAKEVADQLDSNNEQVIAAATLLQISLQESLGRVAFQAWCFERSFKLLLLQTPLFSDHVPIAGYEVDALTKDIASDLGMSADSGLRVKSIIANGPADRAGLRKDDVIVKEGSVIPAIPVLPKEQVKLNVCRGRKTFTAEFAYECRKCGVDCSFNTTVAPSIETQKKSAPSKK